jgi:hypothetical protein
MALIFSDVAGGGAGTDRPAPSYKDGITAGW